MKSNRALDSLFVSISISALCALLGACAFSKGEDKPTPKSTEEEVVDNLQRQKEKELVNGSLAGARIEFIENAEPGSYQLVVHWPKSVRTAELRINDGESLLKYNSESAEFAVNDNREYKVEIKAHGTIGSAPTDMVILRARSPKDHVIESTISQTEDSVLTANRIFFLPAGQIITNGKMLSLNANKIIVRNDPRLDAVASSFENRAHITTFPRNTVVRKSEDLKGSVVKIVANEASGELRVALIGVTGLTGPTGSELEKQNNVSRATPLESLRGPKGRDGVENYKVGRCATGRSNDTRGDCEGSLRCDTQPTSGGPGLKGAEGTKGGTGAKGGKAGTLIVSIARPESFKIDVRQSPGAGGPGGQGAPGFLGGFGGAPGHRPRVCTADVGTGPNGDPGDPGKPGDQGPSGDVAEIDVGNVSIKSSSL